ncbi:hypothetical protein OSTOST_09059 [Ostertagia ostertagi]
MQSVGESVEECPASAYCYNMTASAALVVDVVKAGCSTWRCMLARDKCISTTFQFIPVSLCCCSQDRCNVGGNPAYDSITSGGGGSGGWGGGGSSDGGSSGGGWGGGGSQDGRKCDSTNNNNNNNYNGWGNNNDNQDEQSSRSNVGGLFAEPKPPPHLHRQGAGIPKQIADKFKDYDVDHRDDNNNGVSTVRSRRNAPTREAIRNRGKESLWKGDRAQRIKLF